MDEPQTKAGKGRSYEGKYERAAVALARGATQAEAAAEAGIGVRNLYRHLRQPVYRRHVDELRDAYTNELYTGLLRCAQKTNAALDQLLDSDQPPNCRLGAVRTVLEYVLKGHEQFTLVKRLEEVRKQLGV